MKRALASTSGPPLLALAFGLALVGFQVMAYLDVQAAASALSRGDAERILREANSAWRALGRRPTDADAESFLAEHQEAGLRYIQVDGPFQVRAGAALLGPPDELGVPREGRGRLRLAYAPAPHLGLGGRPRRGDLGLGPHEPPPGPPPGAGPRPPGAPPGPLPPATVVEIEPVRALVLQSRATRSLSLSVVAALLAFLLALAFRRVSHQREALALQAERDRRLAALGEMSSVLAHEIRNPLASLKGHAQLLEELLAADDKARAKASLVVREAERIEALTSSLLEFIRTGEIERAQVDVVGLCEDAIASCGAPVALEHDRAPARAAIDGPRVRQVLDNLLRNALDASKDDAPIELSVHERAGGLTFEVADRGQGIPEADLSRVFEPFVTTKTRGTGLGLAIARRIAEAHGGSLTLARREGGGTVATLMLRDR